MGLSALHQLTLGSNANPVAVVDEMTAPLGWVEPTQLGFVVSFAVPTGHRYSATGKRGDDEVTVELLIPRLRGGLCRFF